MGHSWASTIVNARSEIAELLERGPGLKPQALPLLHKAYPTARRLAQLQTRLPLTTFPATCPWTLEQVLDDDFSQRQTEMQKHHKDLVADVALLLLFAAILCVGWLVLRFVVG